MRILLDFFPILLFFIVYKFYGIYAGTLALMLATAVQMGVIYLIDKKLSSMHKATLLLILVFGALTLYLQDERFIKWKPTVLYFAIAMALAVALWGFRKNFLKAILGTQISLPDRIWYRLNIAWIAYSVFMAVLNGYIAAYWTTAAWMDFKLWGYVFPLVFIVGQGIYLARHIQQVPAQHTEPEQLPK